MKNNAKVTLSHPSIGQKPKWDYLQCDEKQQPDKAWSLITGKNITGQKVELPNFRQISHDLLTQHQLFHGWRTIRTVGIARA